MAINIYIDVSSLACPIETQNENDMVEMERYVEDLVFLRDNLRSELYNFYSSPALADSLFESGLYPVFGDLSHILNKTGLNEVYQPKDVNKIYDVIYNKIPFSPIPVEGDIQYSRISINPELNDLESDEIKATQRSEMGRAAVARTSGWLNSQQLLIFGDFAINSSGCEAITQVEGVAAKGEAATLDGQMAIEYPLEFAEVFPFVRRISRLPNEIDTTAEASRCRSTDQLAAVLSIAMERKARENDATIREWRLGPHFFKSIEELHLLNDLTATRSIVDSLTEAVLKMNLPQTHLLRLNEGGNSGRRRDGDAVAWRRDVGHEYHLHYWEIGDRCELASIVVHGDMTIPSLSSERN
ncbi:hypothetical protein [Caballeronia sp. GAFFF3]|uniref:hypothetical protein n=1 Tax=Caballeronia sp. GAFFF3 TaxID=2921759 RepID=UPI002028CB9A|nr:hypothetical protein [Caballeronia sp. GAFFF3]